MMRKCAVCGRAANEGWRCDFCGIPVCGECCSENGYCPRHEERYQEENAPDDLRDVPATP